MSTMKLSQTEKDLINRMNHPMYTAPFIEGWLNRPSVNVYSNAPVALQQCMVEGFMQAVRAMATIEEKEMVNECCLPMETAKDFTDGAILEKRMVTKEDILRAEKVLQDNGMDEDDAMVVLQAIGYVLLDTELYPE